ncbi:hypothetical protein J6590_037203 [Homalodisca vitripennis]|nr:hypothetical protein J6590_037203 [Homalodisca vitripennis]
MVTINSACVNLSEMPKGCDRPAIPRARYEDIPETLFCWFHSHANTPILERLVRQQKIQEGGFTILLPSPQFLLAAH